MRFTSIFVAFAIFFSALSSFSAGAFAGVKKPNEPMHSCMAQTKVDDWKFVAKRLPTDNFPTTSGACPGQVLKKDEAAIAKKAKDGRQFQMAMFIPSACPSGWASIRVIVQKKQIVRLPWHKKCVSGYFKP